EVASVLVHDDVSLEDRANRRAVGATILVEKIAGAAAESGRSLAEVSALARRTSEAAYSMGVALSGCTSPVVGHPTFQLPAGEMQVGVGIHGETGRRRSLWVKADEIVEMLVTPILHELQLKAGAQVLALVSGLGGTPLSELFIVYRHVHQLLDRAGV